MTPEAPREFLDTTFHPPAGQTHRPRTSGELSNVLSIVRPGETVELAAGLTYAGSFLLPDREDGDWIVIRTSQELPPGRVEALTGLPRLVTTSPVSALTTNPGARRYRLLGVEIASEADITNLTVLKGSDIVLDRCYIHGAPTKKCRRGVALNSSRTAIIDSYISDCHEVGADSQAIAGWDGPGPFKIVNNYLEGAGENVMFGGADPSVSGLIPSDIEFRRNTVKKPFSWRVGDPNYAGIPWGVKNLFELKNAQRVLIEGNTFDGCWQAAQTGFAILFKSVNQDGSAPWSVTQDVEFRNNIVRNAGAGINIQGRAADQPGGQTKRLRIANNLFYNIKTLYGGATFLQITEADDVELSRNTIDQQGTLITAYGPPSRGFRYTENIGRHNTYGVKGDGTASGTATLNAFFNGYVFDSNILTQAPNVYPPNNLLSLLWDSIGFDVDYRQTTALGKGCDIDALLAAMQEPQAPVAPSVKERLLEVIASLQSIANDLN